MKKVAFICQPEYFRFIYENDLDSDFIVREFAYHFGMTEKEFDDLVDFNADYLIFFRGEFFPEEVLRKLRGVKVALSSEPFPRKINGKWEYTIDSWKRYFSFREIRNKSFDYVFHYDISSASLFSFDGFRISGEFVFPVARKVYITKEVKKKFDIFFIGRSTDHREIFFGPLKHRFNFLHIAHGVHGAELVEYMNQSKICLNTHAENEVSWEPRMQMMLATGAFVMSEKITPNAYLKPDVDYIEYTTPQDLFDKVSFYLRNTSEREKIIQNAQKTVDTFFDARRIFVEFFKKIDNGDFQKFESIRGNIFLNLISGLHRCIKK